MQNIRVKLMTPFILGMFALAIGLTGYAYVSARNALEDAVLLVSKAQTAQASNAITLLFKSMDTTMHNMVMEPHLLALFAKPRARDATVSRRAAR